MAVNEFKEFVKKNPSLVKYVKNNEMTWQKFYEMYDLYGENDSVWTDYLKQENTARVASAASTGFGLNEIVNMFKNVDLDSVQEGINNIQRVLGVVSEIGSKDSPKEETKTEYKPRPLYKHFDD